MFPVRLPLAIDRIAIKANQAQLHEEVVEASYGRIVVCEVQILV
jgi:hypothetical protein